MRINKELTMECPMTAEILNSTSHKKTELVIRLAEMQLKSLGYNRDQFRTKEDIRFVIEMMNRGFVAGCSASGVRGRSCTGGKQKRRVSNKKEDVLLQFGHSRFDEGEKKDVQSKGPDDNKEYMDMIRNALGDEEFSGMTGSEV